MNTADKLLCYSMGGLACCVRGPAYVNTDEIEDAIPYAEAVNSNADIEQEQSNNPYEPLKYTGK